MRRQRKRFWLVAGVSGALLALVSLFCFPLAWLVNLYVPLQGGNGTMVAGAGLMLLGLAAALAVAGFTGWRGRPARPFYLRGRWIGAMVVVVLVLALVAALLPADWQLRPFFALFHVGLIALPALLLLTLAGRAAGREAALTWRQMVVALNGGALSTLFAFGLETIGLIGSLVVVGLGAAWIPGGQAELARLTTQLQAWTQGAATAISSEELVQVLASPLVVTLLALVLGIITPVVEELGKGLVIGLLGWGLRPSLRQAFLWGATTGLGFALLEGLFNGALGLGEVAGWLGGIGSRLFASAMHALVSGLVGIGWGLFWRRRRWGLPLFYSGAVAFHSLWNFCVVAMVAGAGQAWRGALLGGLVSLFGSGFLLVLALSAPLALIGLPLLLRKLDWER